MASHGSSRRVGFLQPDLEHSSLPRPASPIPRASPRREKRTSIMRPSRPNATPFSPPPPPPFALPGHYVSTSWPSQMSSQAVSSDKSTENERMLQYRPLIDRVESHPRSSSLPSFSTVNGTARSQTPLPQISLSSQNKQQHHHQQRHRERSISYALPIRIDARRVGLPTLVEIQSHRKTSAPERLRTTLVEGPFHPPVPRHSYSIDYLPTEAHRQAPSLGGRSLRKRHGMEDIRRMSNASITSVTPSDASGPSKTGSTQALSRSPDDDMTLNERRSFLQRMRTLSVGSNGSAGSGRGGSSLSRRLSNAYRRASRGSGSIDTRLERTVSAESCGSWPLDRDRDTGSTSSLVDHGMLGVPRLRRSSAFSGSSSIVSSMRCGEAAVDDGRDKRHDSGGPAPGVYRSAGELRVVNGQPGEDAWVETMGLTELEETRGAESMVDPCRVGEGEDREQRGVQGEEDVEEWSPRYTEHELRIEATLSREWPLPGESKGHT